MRADVDCIPRLMVLNEENFLLPTDLIRNTSWSPSVSSTTSKSTSPSWFEKKLFSHFKRFFRRNSFSSSSNSSASSRRTSSIVEENLPIEEAKPTELNTEVEQKPQQPSSDAPANVQPPSPCSSFSSSSCAISQTSESVPLDPLNNYNQLLQRCFERHERHRTEMILRCQAPVSIPHADLIVGHARSVLINWKSYVRLFRALNRDPKLFQQFINRSYACQSSTNQREHMTLTVRTSRNTFDNLLRTFLDQYVTCFACQKAQTHLIKISKLWRIECLFCGSQRTVERLRWK